MQRDSATLIAKSFRGYLGRRLGRIARWSRFVGEGPQAAPKWANLRAEGTILRSHGVWDEYQVRQDPNVGFYASRAQPNSNRWDLPDGWLKAEQLRVREILERLEPPWTLVQGEACRVAPFGAA